jgi:hypothetical protein
VKGFMTVPSWIGELMKSADPIQLISLLISLSKPVIMIISIGRSPSIQRICVVAWLSILVFQATLFFVVLLSLGHKLRTFLQTTYNEQLAAATTATATTTGNHQSQRVNAPTNPISAALTRINMWMSPLKFMAFIPIPVALFAIFPEWLAYVWPTQIMFASTINFIFLYIMRTVNLNATAPAAHTTPPAQQPQQVHANDGIIITTVAAANAAAAAAVVTAHPNQHSNNNNNHNNNINHSSHHSGVVSITAIGSGGHSSNAANPPNSRGDAYLVSSPQQPHAPRLFSAPITTIINVSHS